MYFSSLSNRSRWCVNDRLTISNVPTIKTTVTLQARSLLLEECFYNIVSYSHHASTHVVQLHFVETNENATVGTNLFGIEQLVALEQRCQAPRIETTYSCNLPISQSCNKAVVMERTTPFAKQCTIHGTRRNTSNHPAIGIEKLQFAGTRRNTEKQTPLCCSWG